MVKKRYKCEVRKRMIVEADNWLQAQQVFIGLMRGHEFEPKVKLYTSGEQIRDINYQKEARKRRRYEHARRKK